MLYTVAIVASCENVHEVTVKLPADISQLWPRRHWRGSCQAVCSIRPVPHCHDSPIRAERASRSGWHHVLPSRCHSRGVSCRAQKENCRAHGWITRDPSEQCVSSCGQIQGNHETHLTPLLTCFFENIKGNRRVVFTSSISPETIHGSETSTF